MTIQYDFESSVCYWASMAALSFRRALNEELAPLGITHRQSQVLAWLVHRGEMSQCELACCMEIEAPTLAGIITRMESAGWIKRRACSRDRRKKLVRIEPAAEPVWAQIAECAQRVRSAATAGLDDEQTERLRSLLEQIHKNLLAFPSARGEEDADCGTWKAHA